MNWNAGREERGGVGWGDESSGRAAFKSMTQAVRSSGPVSPCGFHAFPKRARTRQRGVAITATLDHR